MLVEFLNLIDFTKIRRDAADNVCWMLTNVGLLQSNPSIKYYMLQVPLFSLEKHLEG